MTLDNEEQRGFLLEVMSKVNFPGGILDFAFQMKQAIQNAPVASPSQEILNAERR